MKRLIIAVVLASVAAFAWGAFYWMGPLTAGSFQTQTDDSGLRQTLKEHLPESGAYFVPNPGNDMQEYNRLHKEGPIALIHFVREGRSSNMGLSMLLGFLLHLVFALILAVLLRIASPGLLSYGKRLGFVVLIGLAASLFANAGNAIWWYHSVQWTMLLFFYSLTVYIVMGLVLAGIIRAE